LLTLEAAALTTTVSDFYFCITLINPITDKGFIENILS